MTLPVEPRRKLTITEGMVKRFGMVFSKVSFGDSCGPFNEEMVRTLGAKGFFAWAGAATSSMDPLVAKYGGFSAQLLTAVVAMLNGCTYCGKGHLYAANLHYFKATGKLLGLDEAFVYWLQRQRDHEVMGFVRQALTEGGELEAVRLVNRLFEIKSGMAYRPTTTRGFKRSTAPGTGRHNAA